MPEVQSESMASLDDKFYAVLVEEGRKLIPRFAPKWTDHNAHDPGITFIELFAWLTEMQHYFLNQVTEEAYLKFLRLLGEAPAPILPAKVDVTFRLHAPGSSEEMDRASGLECIPAGTPIQAGEVCFETLEALPLPGHHVQLQAVLSNVGGRLQSIQPHKTDGQAGSLEEFVPAFKPFGDSAACEAAFYLGFNAPFPEGVSFPITLELSEDGSPPPAAHGSETAEIVPSVELEWSYYGSCGQWLAAEVQDGTASLSRSGRVWITFPEKMCQYTLGEKQELYWLGCTVRKAGYESVPRITAIRLHTVGAWQVRTVREEWLGASNGLPNQSFHLSEYPILAESIEIATYDGTSRLRWKKVEDWAASGPSDRHYIVEPTSGTIWFGDGVRGAIPAHSSLTAEQGIIAVQYKTCVGSKGNLPREKLRTVIHMGQKVYSVASSKPATGGADPESCETAQRRVRQMLKTPSRAVTAADYEYLAIHTPGLRVMRAKAFTSSEGLCCQPKDTVLVAVVPYSSYPIPVPSQGFLDTVCRHLNRHRLIGSSVKAIAPIYISVRIEASLSLMQGAVFSQVQQSAAEALTSFLSPLVGGADRGGWPFGRAVYLSEIYEVLEQMTGVDGVHHLKVSSEEEYVKQDHNGNLLIAEQGLVYATTDNIKLSLHRRE